MSNTLSQSVMTVAPSVPQASAPGQIVGLILQNTANSALSAQPVTFAETFALGAISANDQLTATINGTVYAVQMDAKTFNPDGSVATAVLTLDAPALAANSSTDVMLNNAGPAPATAPASVDLASALANYSLSATLDITANAGGATGVQTINISQAVQAALANGTATYWMQGPLATQAIVSIPVSGSLRIEADVTAYANGTVSTDLQFNNDVAMQASGGAITYSTTITQNNVTVATQPSLTQYQYQDWSTTVGTAPSSAGLNIQHDIPYLEAIGAMPNYDTQYGVPSTNIAAEANAVASSGWNAPLGTDGITQYMPTTGGRGDIGPTTQFNATWLITQNATAGQFALGQALDAGSVPWHFYDPTANGTFLNTADYADIWTDGRGGAGSFTTGLTQQVDQGNTGWTPDTAHMPDLSYVAYLQTGNPYYLEQLNAQASFAITDTWPDPSMRNDGQGLVVQGGEIRSSAWSLRAIQEAAYANPAGSADKAYFTQIANNNYTWLISMIPTWTQEQGQAHGWLPGTYGNPGAMPPWEEDYFASTVIQGAEMGNQQALTYLQWASNFLVGRFFAEGQGFNPKDAIAYNLQMQPVSSGSSLNRAPYYTSWAQIEQATEAAGGSNVAGSGMGSGWGQSQGDYGAVALQTLAGIITVSVANPIVMGNYQYQAMQAFGWLLASGAPNVLPSDTAGIEPQFLIDPRLANGQLLSFANVTISNDTSSTVLRPNDPTRNALLYAGSGADTLVGGSGINLLFGGSGADTIIGGPNGNDIFAGPGDETIIAGGGATYIQASTTALLAPGTGSDLFVLNTQEAGAVTVSGFNPSLDHIDLVDANGAPLSASQVSAILASARSVADGVALAVAPNEVLTVQTTNGASVSSAWFEEVTQTLTVSGGGAVTTSAGGSTVTGANGTDTVSSGDNQITLDTDSNTVVSAGKDTVIAASLYNYITVTGASAFVGMPSVGGYEHVTAAGDAETVNVYSNSNVIDATSLTGSAYVFTVGNYNTVTLGVAGAVLMTGANNTITSSGGPIADFGTNNIISATSGIMFEYAVSGSSLTASGNALAYINPGVDTANPVPPHDYVNITESAKAAGHLTASTVIGSDSAQIYLTQLNAGDLVSLSGSAVTRVAGDSVIATGNNLLVTAEGDNFITVSGPQGAVLFATAGNDTVMVNTSFTAFGNAASLDVSNTGSGAITITEGTGAVTVNGGGGTTQVYGGSGGNNLLIGGTGASNYLAADGGNSTLVATGGSTTLVAAGGSESLVAATMTGAANDFLFGAASASVVAGISNFNPSNSQITLTDGVTVTSQATTNVGVTVNLSNGGSILVSGVTSQLTQTTAPGGITTLV